MHIRAFLARIGRWFEPSMFPYSLLQPSAQMFDAARADVLRMEAEIATSDERRLDILREPRTLAYTLSPCLFRPGVTMTEPELPVPADLARPDSPLCLRGTMSTSAEQAIVTCEKIRGEVKSERDRFRRAAIDEVVAAVGVARSALDAANATLVAAKGAFHAARMVAFEAEEHHSAAIAKLLATADSAYESAMSANLGPSGAGAYDPSN